MRVVATLRSTVAISAEVCPTQWDLILRAQPPPPHHRLFLRAGVFHILCILTVFVHFFVEYAQRSYTLRYIVLELVCRHFIFIPHYFTKSTQIFSFRFAMRMHYLIRLPEYVLAIQLVQNRESQ